jgi:hypothetical protein
VGCGERCGQGDRSSKPDIVAVEGAFDHAPSLICRFGSNPSYDFEREIDHAAIANTGGAAGSASCHAPALSQHVKSFNIN